MAELKTKPSTNSISVFIDSIQDPNQKADFFEVYNMMQAITKEKPIMWGSSMVGFGQYHYKYDSGREGSWFITGLSPRKQALTIYLMAGLQDRAEILERLGKYKTGKSCLYIKKISDIDKEVLAELIQVNHNGLRKSSYK